ncbi:MULTISPECIES: FAD-binding oxidoreductase [unclassified Sphingobium]|uniref:FAD-binding oxidoreductase n=1 Tax=unclassified Sphingobium TaxID=2611147 RepID=UPI002225792A|nr:MULTISPECIES: FAD-binding oxidoreductase [unclassified Sphingobium]MCW2381382.1 FAD/FMN-containing dehydrogenase [Sphingobium sp. B2D3B]MCW2398511.1 FAD/FMN-containing dehydrogenase [Sphingobium sp. B2D3C]
MISETVLDAFRAIAGPRGLIEDRDLIVPWLGDWRGKYHGETAAILTPRSTQEVAAMVRCAHDHGVPLVPQGGNTSMVGGATPPADGSALILSLRAMNRIRAIDPAANLAVCEAGVILSTLHEAAAAVGRRFPLSLGAKGSATVGGLVSTNAGGTQVLRHGTMRALVEGIEAVLPDGSIHDGIAALKKDNRGYDLKQLLIGAEGTLGIVTAASLRLVPAIADRAVAWAGVEDPAQALALLRFLERRLGSVVEGFEVMARDTLGHVLDVIPDTRAPIETRTPWNALIEVDLDAADEEESAAARLEATLAEAFEQGLVVDAAIAASEAQTEAFWKLRESGSEAERAQGPALQFDVSVPIADMPRFMIEAAAACEARFPGATASSFGHLGDGNVHFHVRAPAGTGPGQGADWLGTHGEEATRFVNDIVVAMHGSISAEHGIGQMKIAEFARLTPPAQLNAVRAIKRAFDPQGLFNPGKLVPLA